MRRHCILVAAINILCTIGDLINVHPSVKSIVKTWVFQIHVSGTSEVEKNPA